MTPPPYPYRPPIPIAGKAASIGIPNSAIPTSVPPAVPTSHAQISFPKPPILARQNVNIAPETDLTIPKTDFTARIQPQNPPTAPLKLAGFPTMDSGKGRIAGAVPPSAIALALRPEPFESHGWRPFTPNRHSGGSRRCPPEADAGIRWLQSLSAFQISSSNALTGFGESLSLRVGISSAIALPW